MNSRNADDADGYDEQPITTECTNSTEKNKTVGTQMAMMVMMNSH